MGGFGVFLGAWGGVWVPWDTHASPSHPPPPQLPPPEVPVAVAPPRLQRLLGRWREKVFALLVQLRVQEEAQRVLRAQVGARVPSGGFLSPIWEDWGGIQIPGSLPGRGS